MVALRRVTWLGQAYGDGPLPSVVDAQQRSDGWTRTEKILLLGVIVNATYLIYSVLRRRDVRSAMAGSSY